ncbi:ornithine cyclodeaminase family protein [Oscillatoria sp. FACHB-1407]|uniref:ornithine cyclodeaminase family protein n=1 Tax=Oscillatoria sp. FACHB-1407 TaxID=2692847 RepID=UPI0016871FF2|nr:ornithine cyclodeaminase family protein [Oscillatoria sp. FACHB-1407]MBD2465836.1 ornithine cyclodeaminase family protein [Oscillatoria sp. FACHB-1407]
MKIIELDRIRELLSSINLFSAIEAGFVSYSAGKAVIPPVGELLFQTPPGDVHIKYGYLLDDHYYVIKIASGFYENPALGLPSSNGLMLLFDQKTGELLAILLDEGYLTDVRTAVAGAIAAKYLAPQHIHRIGIVGTGIQARLQLQYLAQVIQCREAIVWGRNLNHAKQYQQDMTGEFNIAVAQTLQDLTSTCNLIVTTTPSTVPLIHSNYIQPGTHITAVGADTPHKQELDPMIFAGADCVVADSIPQCIERGDIAHAIAQRYITPAHLIELGDIISNKAPGRISNDQITVTDLTGLAVQDIQIAKVIYETVTGRKFHAALS